MTLLHHSYPNEIRLHILIAEDSVMHQALAERLLQKLGCSVTITCNGREAVEAYGRQKFDLVLMDIDMPEMDGLQATAAIRAIEQETGQHTPVVALTATGSSKQCRAAGMDGHIAKPLNAHVLDTEMARLEICIVSEQTGGGRSYSDSSQTGPGKRQTGPRKRSRSSSAPLA
jgi:CheY-like chemotaxis protein